MSELTKEEFLLYNMLDDRSYEDIASLYGISRKQLSEWWHSGAELRAELSKSNQIFNSKKGNPEFAFFKTKRQFFEWYKTQERSCHYCGIEESKLKALFGNNGLFKTKRFRGKSLELERKDAVSNLYSDQNCVLACYLCNNHKSDYITDIDHISYFAPAIRLYLEDKFSTFTTER